MIDRECLKGFILAPSPTDGENVPFFVLVRDKDIIWDETNIPVKIKAILEDGEENVVVIPASSYKSKIKDWCVEIHADGSFIAKKKINIGESFISDESPSPAIHCDIKLPFDIKNDDEMFISYFVTSDSTKVSQSFVVQDDIEEESFDNMKVYIINSTSNFPTDFKETHVFDKSFLHVKIEGNIRM